MKKRRVSKKKYKGTSGDLILKLVLLHGQFTIIPELPLMFRTFARLNKTQYAWLRKAMPLTHLSITSVLDPKAVTVEYTHGAGVPSEIWLNANCSKRIHLLRWNFSDTVMNITMTLWTNGPPIGIYIYARHGTSIFEQWQPENPPFKTEMTIDDNAVNVYIVRYFNSVSQCFSFISLGEMSRYTNSSTTNNVGASFFSPPSSFFPYSLKNSTCKLRGSVSTMCKSSNRVYLKGAQRV